jgi:hypothetical protein
MNFRDNGAPSPSTEIDSNLLRLCCSTPHRGWNLSVDGGVNPCIAIREEPWEHAEVLAGRGEIILTINSISSAIRKSAVESR